MEKNVIELYRKYRPQTLSEVFGQSAAIKTIRQLGRNGKFPHAILFSGPSGTGKTTLGRLLAHKLGCDDVDFIEQNCGDLRGIDDIRELSLQMQFLPMSGQKRVWLLDEAHQLTSAAANAFLKPLEDVPDHVYWFLATTSPGKLIRTIRTRCTEIKLNSLSKKDLEKLVLFVAEKEEKQIDDVVVNQIVETSEGSARQALVLLHKIISLEKADDQLAALQQEDDPEIMDLCRALVDKKKTWKDVAGLLKGLDDDPERIRRVVLGYASSMMLRGSVVGDSLFAAFQFDFFASGKSGLVNACREMKR